MTQNKPAKHRKIDKQSIFKWIRYLLVMFVLIASVYAAFHYIPALAKYNHFVIGSGSMEPVLMVNDIVVINEEVPLDTLKAGDIVAFYADIRDNGVDEIVIHYLFSVTITDGVRIFRTKSAINDNVDAWELTDEDIIGLHVLTIPRVGRILMFIESPLGKIVIILDIVLIYLFIKILFAPIKKKHSSNSLPSEF